MKRLFLNSLRQTFQRLGIQDLALFQRESANIEELINSALNHDVSYSKLNRLPLSEVKNMLKMPCPIGSQPDERAKKEQIAIFKRMRHHFAVEEEAVCFKCKRNCPLRAIPFKSLDEKPKTSNKSALHDLLFYLLSLQKARQEEYSQLRWSAAFKVTSSLQVLIEDYKILSKQSLLFRQVYKQLDEEQTQLLNRNKSPKVKQVEDVKLKLKERRIRLQKSPFQ